MVKLTCPRSTSRGIWHSLGIEPRLRNSHPTSGTITPRRNKCRVNSQCKKQNTSRFFFQILYSQINYKKNLYQVHCSISYLVKKVLSEKRDVQALKQPCWQFHCIYGKRKQTKWTKHLFIISDTISYSSEKDRDFKDICYIEHWRICIVFEEIDTIKQRICTKHN